MEAINTNVPQRAQSSQNMAIVLGMLFLYSVAMFSLPFAAFFGVQHILTDYYPKSKFERTVWSVAASVLVVNSIIFAYAYKAYYEKEYDDEGNEIDQHAYVASPPANSASAVYKCNLNVKQD